MRRDPHLRDSRDTTLLYPGSVNWRVRMVAPDHPDLVRVRQDTPEGSPGLFVVELDGNGSKALVEAHYPEDIRPEFFENLDPFRQHDSEMGRPIIVALVKRYAGELTRAITDEISQNARNARRNLRRTLDSLGLQREIRGEYEATRKGVAEEFGDHVEDAFKETEQFQKPKVSMAGRSVAP